jgi:hypothetical protein
MSRLIAGLALITGLLCAAAVGLVRAQPANDADVRVLLEATSDCPPETACWMGITPGVTTANEAVTRLRANPWVGEVLESEGSFAWTWSGQQPAFITADRYGLLAIRGGRVVTMRIQTTLPFGAVWMALQAPEESLLIRAMSRSSAYQIASWSDDAVQVISNLSCPGRPDRLWFSAVSVGRGEIWATEAINGYDFDVFGAPDWWTAVRLCRPLSASR